MQDKKKIYLIAADFAQPSPSGLYGHLEGIDASGLTGWLVDLDGLTGSITLFIGSLPAASGCLDIWRPDVADLIGNPRSYGFHLSWQYWNLRKAELDPARKYPLVFAFNDKLFIFGNRPEITGEELMEYARSLPERKTPPDTSQLVKDFGECLGSDEPHLRLDGDVRLVAFYLPQFHPIPENDAWWGHGFTEWTNVAKARPLFRGHYQPQLPGELGFYDLRLARTRQDQANMAREYGIFGFCYYYYWFAGKKLLQLPLEEVLRSGEPDFPFCICWANESWSRRWNGSEDDLLARQAHDPDSDRAFIEAVIPILLDPRYIHIGGAPILLVYRAPLLANPQQTTKEWRDICKKYGIDRLHLCAVEAFEHIDPLAIGFDSTAQFPPHLVYPHWMNREIEDLPPDFKGSVLDYEDVVRREIIRPRSGHMNFPGVMNAWDNTARRGLNGDIYYGSTPALYETWLRAAMDRARSDLPEGQRIVFINAWNEWAEGAHLEPDLKYGRAWLEATRRALTRQTDWRQLLAGARAAKQLEGQGKDALLDDLEIQLERLQLQVEWYDKNFDKGACGISVFKAGPPPSVEGMAILSGGQMGIEVSGPQTAPALVSTGKKDPLYCRGWSFVQGAQLAPDIPTYMVLLESGADNILYHAFIHKREERPDLSAICAGAAPDTIKYAGFSQLFDLQDVANGLYRPGVLVLEPQGAFLAAGNTRLEVE